MFITVWWMLYGVLFGLALWVRGRRVPCFTRGMRLVWWGFDGERSYALIYVLSFDDAKRVLEVLRGRGWSGIVYYPRLAYVWSVDLALYYPGLARLGAGLEYVVAHAAAVPRVRSLQRVVVAGDEYYVLAGPSYIAVNDMVAEYPTPLNVYRDYTRISSMIA